MDGKKYKPHKMLRDFRTALGLSQSAFGREASIHEVYISQIETGDARIGAVTGLRILARWPSEAIAAGITLQSLLEEQRGERGTGGRLKEQGLHGDDATGTEFH